MIFALDPQSSSFKSPFVLNLCTTTLPTMQFNLVKLFTLIAAVGTTCSTASPIVERDVRPITRLTVYDVTNCIPGERP